MFTLYKMQIVPTNHDNINSKWHQYKLNKSYSIHTSELSTKAKYKITCFKGNGPLQPTRVLKVSANSRNKINEKKGGLEEDQDQHQYPKPSCSEHSLAIDLFVTFPPFHKIQLPRDAS